MKTKNTQLSRRLRALAALLVLTLAVSSIAVNVLAGGDPPCDISASPCLVKMVEKLKTRGWAGIEMDTSEDGGLRVTAVIAGSPAQKGGLRVGDILREVNRVPYRKDNMAALDKIYQMMVPNQTLTYTVERQAKTLQVQVKLAKVPEQLMAQWIGHHVLEAYEMLQARNGSGER